MPSHLTRSVFRRLLANQPIVHRGCLRRRQHCSLAPASGLVHACPGRPIQPWIQQREQRRHFLNFNIFSSKREAKEADMDPGIEKMMELAKRQRMDARMPPVEDVWRAVQAFVRQKSRNRQSITDSQARLVHQSLQYCFSTIDANEGNIDKGVVMIEVSRIVHLYVPDGSVSDAHVQLAQLLYENRFVGNVRNPGMLAATYVKMLSSSGSPRMARDLLLHLEQSLAKDSNLPPSEPEPGDESHHFDTAQTGHTSESTAPIPRLPTMWYTVLKGFVSEKSAAEVYQTLEMIQQRGYAGHGGVTAVMIDFCIEQNDVSELKHWWAAHREAGPRAGQSLQRQIESDGRRLHDILRWCLKTNNIQLGHEFVQKAMADNPPKPFWDAIFVWAAGTKKSVDEIGRMMTVMEKSNEDVANRKEWRLPDITTINSLVQFAISQNDPYMAERFIALGRERNIEPDARTLVLQMDYRLDVGDVDGALIAYKALIEHKNAKVVDESFKDDIAAINRLIVALCGTQRHDFDTIMNVAMDLADRHARFEAETVSTLALLHLKRDEADDATDLLNTHAYHFSSAERLQIRNAILNLAIDPKTPTSRAWSSYNILRDIFDETPREKRTELMTAFFNRERADMGVRIFQQMRMHSRSDTIPTIDTYVAAFMGLAKLRDIDSVEIIHNQLKLDFNITVTTYLRNALIIAYTAGDKGRKALGFWDDIVASKEGPSYNSIHVALRACENSPFGDLRAKELWSLLRRRNVELDQPLWASYVAALAGNGDNDSAINTVEEAEASGAFEVDAFLLGSLMHAARGEVKQQEVEKWAREKYLEQWESLEAFGSETDIAGQRTFNIDRRVAP